MHLRGRVLGVRDEDPEPDLPSMSAGGKKRQLLGNGGDAMDRERGKRAKLGDEEAAELDAQLVQDIEKLQELQDELERGGEMNEEASDKVLEVEQFYNEIRRPLYDKRNEIINNIPDFWLNAFLSHPVLRDLLTDEDQKVFKYLESVDVNDNKDVKSGYYISFKFKANPYFNDKILTKVFNFPEEGPVEVSGTQPRWKKGMNLTNGVVAIKGQKRPHVEEDSFFRWFTDAELKVSIDGIQYEVGEVIKDELWPNPLKYFNNEQVEELESGDDEVKGDDDEEDDRYDDAGEGATAFEFDSGDEYAEAKHVEQACTLVLDDGPDDSDLVCFKRKRSLRLKAQNQSSPAKVELHRAFIGNCSKRRRGDAQKKTGEPDREPTVILAWKHWCMYEEDDEEIDVLVNKRDERRRLERQSELQRQEHKTENAADSTGVEAPENVMSSNNEAQIVVEQEAKDESQLPLVAESGASHVDKRAVVSGDLRSLTERDEQLLPMVSGEGAEGSNTPAGIDSKLRKSPGRKGTSDSDIEIASGSVPVDVNLGVGGIQSRAGSTQALIIGDQQTDPSFFSAQEDSMVLDTIAEGVTTNSIAAITSHESISQSTLNDICTKSKAHGGDKKKGIPESGTSYCGRHGDALIADLAEQQGGTDGVEPAVETLGAGDSAGFGVPGSVLESSNQLHGNHPTINTCGMSEQDWGQSSGSAMPVVATCLGLEVCEEQGESIGGPNKVAHRRGKQKVIELSDEEEDSNRVSIERRVHSEQHSYHGLEGRTWSYGDAGGAAISGAEISSVEVAGRFGGAGRHLALAEHLRLVEYDDTDGGTVESNAPFQASAGLDEEQVKTYRRRGRNQGKAIAGEDSGEEVRGPTTRRDGESSDVDSHEGQLGGDLPPAVIPIYCPVCSQELEPGMSNDKINDHIDKCLL